MTDKACSHQDWLGQPIEDASEETFLLFSQDIPSNSLGFVDGSSTTLEVEVGSRTLSITQSPGVLNSNRSAGTTGAVLWKITPLVADWLVSQPQFLKDAGILHRDAVVVELGCGVVGLIGIAMSPFIGTYLLTDQAYVKKLLSGNIDANTTASVSNRRGNNGHVKLSPKPTFVTLDWETDSAAGLLSGIPNGSQIDLVVVCDCVYNEHLIKPLVDTLGDVCALTASEKQYTYVLIAQQLRSDEILERFLAALMEGFKVWRVPDEHLSKSLGPGSGYVVHLACLKA